VNLLIVSTHLSPGNRTLAAAHEAAEAASRQGFVPEVLDLATVPLPPCDGNTCYADPRVIEVTAKVAAAAAVWFCSPVYNYNLNSAAKQFVELTNSAWPDKIVACVATAGGSFAFMAWLPLANSLLVDHHCHLVPRHVYLSRDSVDESGRLNESSIKRLDDLGLQTARLVRGLQAV
jgi:NAD(P)H-dependent FMN reductase